MSIASAENAAANCQLADARRAAHQGTDSRAFVYLGRVRPNAQKIADPCRVSYSVWSARTTGFRCDSESGSQERFVCLLDHRTRPTLGVLVREYESGSVLLTCRRLGVLVQEHHITGDDQALKALDDGLSAPARAATSTE
jgi:hypothetical protein